MTELTIQEKINFDEMLLQSGDLTETGRNFTLLRLERNKKIYREFFAWY